MTPKNTPMFQYFINFISRFPKDRWNEIGGRSPYSILIRYIAFTSLFSTVLPSLLLDQMKKDLEKIKLAANWLADSIIQRLLHQHFKQLYYLPLSTPVPNCTHSIKYSCIEHFCVPCITLGTRNPYWASKACMMLAFLQFIFFHWFLTRKNIHPSRAYGNEWWYLGLFNDWDNPLAFTEQHME